MSITTVEALVEGGKATAGPPIGPQLGPLGVNIGKIVADINQKTSSFKGMNVPVKIEINSDTKEHTIIVGTPPASSLISKEAGVAKGASNPLTDKVADLRIEQIIKIAKMKEDSLLGKTLKEKVLEITGTCNSMGILVHGIPAKEAIKLIKEGRFDKEIKEQKTELTEEELKTLEEEKKRLAVEIEKRREEFNAKAKEILKSMEGKTKGEIKAKMVEAGIPTPIIEENLPTEGVKKEGEEKPAAVPKEEKPKEK